MADVQVMSMNGQLDNEQEEGDRLFNDILLVHKDFEFYLFGTILDWSESKFKSEFTITNPNLNHLWLWRKF